MTRERSAEFWELAIAVNAAFKGLLGSMGQSGHICRRTVPISVRLDTDRGWPSVLAVIAASVGPKLHEGDVVVVADKIVAVSLGRMGPREILLSPDPKTTPFAELGAIAGRWTERLGFLITPLHLLIADEFESDRATLGADDHNARCAEVAEAIWQRFQVRVDVIISDTDTGLDNRHPLIGTVTIGASPLGATAGVNLYEAMRCAVAAEFERGHDKGIPIVICVPADRRRKREAIGAARPYGGFLDADREPTLAHA